MGVVLKNNAKTLLSADISSLDTDIPVVSVASFPALGVGDYFYLTLESTGGAYEIMKVTQVNASSFTATRAQEGTIAVPFNIGARIELRVTVQNLEDFLLTGNNINNAAYDSSWATDTEDAPSRAAIYNKIESIDIDTSLFALWSGGNFTGDVAIKNGVFSIGDSTFNGDAAVTLGYTSGAGNSGSIIWQRSGTTKWYARSAASSDAWFLRNNVTGTDAINFASATNNATFTGTVSVPDDAYAAGWNGSTTVPTKNAVYDKIEANDGLYAKLAGAAFVGAISTLSGSITSGWNKYSGDANFTLEYDNAFGATGSIIWKRDNTTMWYMRSSSSSTFFLRNNGLGTDALNFDYSTNNATFTGTVTVPDDAYASGWNGSTAVPTKNAVYDKIESLTFSVSDGDKGDITVSSSGATWTIDNSVVTLAKMANINQYELIGRSSASAGVPQAIATSANVFTLLGSANYSAFRTSLGLGTSATVNTGTSGATIPLLNAANTWATTQTFTVAPVFTDASGTRTALGLGTVATQNTGTSGANIPFLNGANTWSGTQIFAYDDVTTFNRTSATAFHMALSNSGTVRGYIGADSNKSVILYTSAGSEYFSAANTTGVVTFTARPVFGSNTALDVGNGVQLAADNTITGSHQVIANNDPRFTLRDLNAGTNEKNYSFAIDTGTFYFQTVNDAFNSPNTVFTVTRTGTTPLVLDIPVAEIRAVASALRVSVSSETSGTLTAASANRQINATGNVTFNGSVFTAGDRGEIYAGSSGRTITQGSGMTLRLDGTATTGSRTLAAYGRASWYAVSASEIIVTGVT